MGDNNIPIIEPTIDYTKVPPIHQKRTISFINHFVVNTVSSLNKLALTCEEKLFEFENQLQRVEAAVVILESRFASIPSSEEQPIAKDSPNENAAISGKEEESVTVPAKEETPDIDETDQDAGQSQPAAVEEQDNLILVTQHPLYEKYFKMMRLGIPKEAVKPRMIIEGLDPELLDDPHRRVPQVDSTSSKAAT